MGIDDYVIIFATVRVCFGCDLGYNWNLEAEA